MFILTLSQRVMLPDTLDLSKIQIGWHNQYYTKQIPGAQQVMAG